MTGEDCMHVSYTSDEHDPRANESGLQGWVWSVPARPLPDATQRNEKYEFWRVSRSASRLAVANPLTLTVWCAIPTLPVMREAF